MMNKRRYGALLAAVLCISMIVSLPVLAETSESSPTVTSGNEAVFELSYPSELPAVGEIFEVTVSLKNNPGVSSLDLILSADNSIVECLSADPGDVLQKMLNVTNPKADTGAIFVAASAENISDTGVLGKVTYRVVGDGDPAFRLVIDELYNESDDIVEHSVQYLSGKTETPAGPSVDNPSGPPADPSDEPGKTPSDQPSDQPGDTPPDQPGEQPPDTPGGTPPDPSGETVPVPSVSYSDMTDAHWAYEYVCRATEAGLFNGFPDGSFHPDENVTRAQFITVLWRMSHSPAAGTETSVQFTDTPSGGYYYDAVRWGAGNNLINGVENPDGTFSYLPDATITREQVMTILFRYDGEKSGMESLFTATYDNQFKDSGEISDYAKKAVYWAYYKTYISGTSSHTLDPKGLATRAQISKILVEYLSADDA